MTLRLAKGLELPLETVTETIAVLGIRGSGKTNTAVVATEELLEHGQQVVVIDPTDVWWGLKSSADGKRAGYPVVVLGGRHQDLPLTAADGATLADFVVDERASVILSVRHFESQADQRRLVTDFARRLYFRKGHEGKDTPLMVVFDEASLFVPQRVTGAEAAMVGAIQKLVRQGRSSGIGVTLIDQRASTVNKDVLTQLELLVCHRTSSPQDRKALEAWVEQHDAGGHREEFLRALAGLAQGTAWFWSPGWLDVFKQVQVRQRRTFDSSRTPKAGERRIEPTKLAEADLDTLRAKLATTIEKAKADDPKELRAQVAKLTRELATVQSRPAAAAPAPKPIEVKVPVFAAGELQRLEEASDRALGAAQAVREATQELREAQSEVSGCLDRARQLAAPRPTASPVVARPRTTTVPMSPTRATPVPARRAEASASGITAPQQRILNALAWLESVRIDRAHKVQLALLAEASPKSSAYANNLGVLRTAGLIDYPGPGAVALTPAGRAAAQAPDTPPTTDDLHRTLYAQLPVPQTRILQQLIRVYPEPLAKGALADLAEASASSSAFANNLGTLRSLGFIDYPSPGQVIARDVLFLD